MPWNSWKIKKISDENENAIWCARTMPAAGWPDIVVDLIVGGENGGNRDRGRDIALNDAINDHSN